MVSYILWVPVLVCLLGIRRKVAERVLAVQHSCLGKQLDWVCKACTVRKAWQILAITHRDISRAHNMLHGRFSFYSDKKG